MTSASPAPVAVDVAIVGGGIVGLLLANLLAGLQRRERPLQIAVIESRPPGPAVDAELDVRVSALSPESLGLLAQVDCLARLPDHAVCAYEHMRVWQANDGPFGARSIGFSAAELGQPQLGSIVENRAVRVALWQRLQQIPNCQLVTQPTVDLNDENDAYVLQLADTQVRAQLLVAADGARSWLREQLGVACREYASGENALVTHLATTLPHASTAWQKFLPGGPAALLPLADGRVSLVWSHPQAETEALLALADDEFAQRLTNEMDGVLGPLRCTTPRFSFPLQSVHAEAYTGRGFALVGDAAHRVHPLAGQGANLGIRDAAELAQVLTTHLKSPWANPGDPAILRRYERARKGDNAITLAAMQGLDGVFRSALADMAGNGMGLVDKAGPVKAMLARYAMGA